MAAAASRRAFGMTCEYRSIVIDSCGVTQHIHNDPRRHSLRQQQRRTAMPQVVKSDPPQTRCCHQQIKGAREVSRLDHRSDRRRKDQPRLLPAVTSCQPLRVLAVPMRKQSRQRRLRQRDSAPGPGRLPRAEHQALTPQPLHRLTHPHCAADQIDVAPAEGQQLALAHTDRDPDGE